jgi:uncharacterized membrane protein YfcA
MFLEIATSLGALFGAFLGTHVAARHLSILFGLILLQAAWQNSRGRWHSYTYLPPDPLAKLLELIVA